MANPLNSLSPRTRSILTGIVMVAVVLVTWWSYTSESDEDTSARPAAESTSAAPSTSSSASSASSASSKAPSSPSNVPSTPSGDSGGGIDPDSGLPYVDLADLPVDAAKVVSLIDVGGPFPYPDKDGSTFGNYEGLLPDHERGYYAEYTVPTPGSYDRGARRIIEGDAGELYWTEDHYESFERIRR